jgi:hypothetical protein
MEILKKLSLVRALIRSAMVTAHGNDVKMSSMNVHVARDELVATLEEALRLQRRLVADARDDRVPVADLVAQVIVLERLDDRRDDLLGELRRTASADMRATRPGSPMREVVLETLTELRWPQNAGFLEEYIWAERQLQLESRAFAPLRRDERRAWDHAPGARRAYIVPVLNPDGSANPRWISRSDWGLERRIVASGQTERLLNLQKIYSLAGRPGSADAYARGPRGPVDALLERYAKQFLGTEPPPVSASADVASTWRAQVRKDVEARIGEIRSSDEPHRSQIARQLADLPEQERLWGKKPASRPKDRTKRQARRAD